jgi:MYXO-CTERM domain-containing protein
MRNTKLAAFGAALILSTSTAGVALAQESTTETTVTSTPVETEEDNDFPWGLLGLLGLLGLAGLRKKEEPVRRDTPAQGSSTIRPT